MSITAPPPEEVLSSGAIPHSVGHALPRLSRKARAINLLAVVVPFLGLIAGAISVWGWGVSWGHLILLFVMYVLTGLGITVGYHRLFTHRSFDTFLPIQFLFGVLGSMALQGPLFRWVAMHRKHHQLSDQEGDPHSPHTEGEGFIGLIRGGWHAHMGWLFRADPPGLQRYIKDLRQLRSAWLLNALWPVWVLVGLIIPTAIGGMITGTWTGALLGFIWGGLVRIFVVHHITWSVNSVCHIWGQQPYKLSEDESRNNFIFGVLALGEGWHNNHHAFPTSARHGLRWWQFDFSYIVIRALALCGLAWNVKLPSEKSLKPTA